MAPAIGIDLGTTYSCVAVWQYGMVEIIANDQGNRTMPSFVAFTETERLIGEAAKNQVAQNAENTIFDAKRLIGRNFSDATVQEDLKHFPFSVVNENGKPNVEVEYKGQVKRFCVEEISAMILGKMREIAEAFLNEKVTDAVITVPAYFNDSQRQATKDAVAIAGLNVLRIINEPTAAAIAYGLDKKAQGERNILIFDLGGGTFDVSILTIDDGVFEVKATSGDTHLGGEDFDSRLVNFFASEFRRKHGRDLTDDRRALRRLRTACEQAKRTLSSASQTMVQVPALAGGVDFSSSITRAKFEDLCADLFNSTLEPVKKALKEAEMAQEDIEEVILVGGSTRIPKIQRLLENFFNGKKLNNSINPDEAVAYGAAVQAAILNGDDADSPELQEILLLDVTPLSLGIRCLGGVISPLIKANSTIPTKETKDFTTTDDYQKSVSIAVYQGDRPMAEDCKLLGDFILNDLACQPRGVPKIDVTFSIDVNGILSVTAKDRDTCSQNAITIAKNSGQLTQQQIDQMRRDAEQFLEEDQKRKERTEARNALDLYAYQMQTTVSQAKARGQISEANYQRVGDSVEGTLKWLKEHEEDATLAEIQNKKGELERVCNPIVTKLFS